MKYLLDTNICIQFFRGDFNLIDNFLETELQDCAISEIITLAELVFGTENNSNPKKNYRLLDSFSEQIRVLPIYNEIQIYAQEKVRLRRNGNMISDFDLLIGSTAIANDLIMITENSKEFNRISKIKIENWIKR